MVSTASARQPVLGITMGDPLGIGPEVLVRALANQQALPDARFVIYGCNETLALQCDRLGVQLQWARIPHDSSRLDDPVRSPILVRDFAYPESLRTIEAQPTIAGGQLSKQLVETAIKDAMRSPDDPKHIDAIVTGPISKQAWSMAGSRFPGHTELLAHRTRAKRHAMLFESKQLTVVLATAHIPLMDLRNLLTIGRVFDPIDLGAAWCRGMGIRNPRVAVCGLNPHAGEDGLLGDEDKRIIAPAIEMARNAGIDTHGPFSADTIFRSAAAGDWDLVVAMYHDQGLIPVKLLGFHDAVNVTTGLPFIRTSPDHGTGYDIASHSSADPSSMLAAITLAARQTSAAVLSGN